MLLALLYALVVVCLSLYGFHSLVLAVLCLAHRKRAALLSQPSPPVDEETLPLVTVQVPLYNELYVVERVIDAVAALEYPRERLQIQILDDSTDATTALASARADHYRKQGIDITVLRRPTRQGFKAGALAWGLSQARGEYIAIFDADFCPRPDFLLRTIPHFIARPRLGMVQTRWSHLNAEYSLLTRAQALAIDGHFMVEQTGRNCAGLLTSFNGAAGVWRRRCIEEAGGWQDDTLCEDLDLSYRAQLAGWECLYLPSVDTPAELPPQIAAFKLQQARWAQGAMQVLRKLGGEILRSRRLKWPQKVMGLLHLSNYLPFPLIVLALVLSLPLLLVPESRRFALDGLGLAFLGPLLVYTISQKRLYSRWWLNMLVFPLLTLIGIGIAWSNAKAVWRGLTGQGGIFARTPKFRLEGKEGSWSRNCYSLPLSDSVAGEIALMCYAVTAVIVARATGQEGMLPVLWLYAIAFGTVAGLEIMQAIVYKTASQHAAPPKMPDGSLRR
ncbi:MAG: glycosyltransferase family 2 protein, partial [Anaerolineae bacterium]|nr:glycosyltransferase family 2 protein [Anaerolineae bacterium]